ncbi:Uma2 family endonuclease [Streptomyces sp. NPDC058657]|uniref:Uma2 family endonuclease n=1 Tax=unclassified Streptomyces TaxID=2593676 RepID=UPI00364CB865
MTVMVERTSGMSVEEFEAIAKAAAAESDAARFEYIDGRAREKIVPDGDHNEIVEWLRALCMQHQPSWALYGSDQGLKVETYRAGRARPDGILAPRGTFAGQGEWADPDGVLMVVEVTSYDSDTDRRDRQEKPVAYAAAGIPVYLLVDRDAGAVLVHSEPSPTGYGDVHTVRFGAAPVALPAPVGIVLDTEVLKQYVR